VPHWADAYYGALYLDSVGDLLTPALSAAEARAIAALLALGPGDVVLDLACGHGRHAAALAGRVGCLVGLDRSAEYLRRAEATSDLATTVTPAALSPRPSPPLRGGEREPQVPRYVRGDLRELPFADGSFDALFSWYASLFMFGDAANEAALAEAARVVRPGGRLLVHHANPARLAAAPVEEARRTLPDGSIVEERSRYDATRGVDVAERRIVRPDGAVLAGAAELRYYKPSEWRRLAVAARLRLVEVTSTPDALRAARRAPGPEAPDLIALLEKPT
jgi:SAM-dependent methyltransferase